MPRAEPALSLAPLPLSAVVGAAIPSAITKTTLCTNGGVQRLAEGQSAATPGWAAL